jgi:hypothetical protein
MMELALFHSGDTNFERAWGGREEFERREALIPVPLHVASFFPSPRHIDYQAVYSDKTKPDSYLIKKI